MDRFSAVGRRWCDVILVGVISALIWQIIDYSGSSWILSTQEVIARFVDHFPVLSCAYVVIVGFLATRLLRSFSGFRLSHLRCWSYPSFLWGGVIAIAILASMRGSGLLGASFTGIDWISVLVAVSLMILIAALSEFPTSKCTSSVVNIVKSRMSNDRSDCINPESIEAWSAIERPIQSTADDQFDHRFIAMRIARHLLSKSKTTVGIVGEYGSGKSSIVNMTKELTSHETGQRLWFCEVDCWGFDNASAAIERIFEGVMHRIGEQVDCASMQSLPHKYLKAISSTHPYLGAIESLFGERVGPEHVIQELSRVLTACSVRLVVVIQDLDRNPGTQFDTSAVSALLDRFRSSEGISFILASGRLPDLDFTRLCEHIEPIPRLTRGLAKGILSRLREDCLRSFEGTDVDLGSADQRRQFDLETALGWFRPITESIIALVNTPRQLKFLDRRVRAAWKSLHGEIDIDDLIVVTTLRYCAPEAVDFLHQYRHELVFGVNEGYSSSLGDKQEEQNKQLSAIFDGVVAKSRWDADALRHLIDFLFPNANKVLGGRSSLNRNALQGVAAQSHVDYWSRAFVEELAPNEIRDQQVIKYIDACKTGRGAIVQLADRMLESQAFCDGWEYFASRMTLPMLYSLVEILCKKLLDRYKASAEGDHWAIISAWRVINRRPIQRNDSRRWLVVRLRKALRQSLGFYNDIFHYWTGKHGIVSTSDVQSIRDEMLSYSQRCFTSSSPDSFLKVLSANHPWAIRHFIVPPEQYEGLVAPANPGQWDWFLPILVKAIRNAPELVLPQVARLISKDIDQSTYDEMHMARVSYRTWAIDRELAHLLFGAEVKLIVSAISRFSFESNANSDAERLAAIHESAREWLNELE